MNPNLIWFTCWFKELLKLLKKFITYSRCWLWNKGYYLKLVDFSFDFYYFRIHWLVCLKIDVSSKPMWLKITSFVLGYFTFLHCTLYLKKYDLIHVVTNTLCNCNQVFQIIFWHATFYRTCLQQLWFFNKIWAHLENLAGKYSFVCLFFLFNCYTVLVDFFIKVFSLLS